MTAVNGWQEMPPNKRDLRMYSEIVMKLNIRIEVRIAKNAFILLKEFLVSKVIFEFEANIEPIDSFDSDVDRIE